MNRICDVHAMDNENRAPGDRWQVSNCQLHSVKPKTTECYYLLNYFRRDFVCWLFFKLIFIHRFPLTLMLVCLAKNQTKCPPPKKSIDRRNAKRRKKNEKTHSENFKWCCQCKPLWLHRSKRQSSFSIQIKNITAYLPPSSASNEYFAMACRRILCEVNFQLKKLYNYRWMIWIHEANFWRKKSGFNAIVSMNAKH